MQNDFIPLLPSQVYHLYNHAVGSENLFREDANYLYFLDLYQKHIVPVCRTYSYALMSNHFHLLVQVRPMELLAALASPRKRLDTLDNAAEFVMQQFSNFFNAYAKAYNKRYNRRGALFVDYLRRKPVDNAHYFQQVVLYHHFNPVRHDFCDTPLGYRFSSYPAYLSDQPTLIERDVVIARFGGRESFIARHQGYDWRTDDDLDF
jgi:REP element-mobilizing transposase RayT